MQEAKEKKEDVEVQAAAKKEVAALLALKAGLEKAEAGCAELTCTSAMVGRSGLAVGTCTGVIRSTPSCEKEGKRNEWHDLSGWLETGFNEECLGWHRRQARSTCLPLAALNLSITVTWWDQNENRSWKAPESHS